MKFILVFVTVLCAGSFVVLPRTTHVPAPAPVEYAYTPPVGDSVLICKSSNAYAYHKKYCQGLNRCTHTVEKVTLTRAKELGYDKACGYCYR